MARIQTSEEVDLAAVRDRVLELHQSGKIHTASTVALESPEDLHDIYTPGVALVCRAIHDDSEMAHTYTNIPSTVAIVTNGTAILGLGDIGPVAGMPVMEGKAVLFEKLVGISGVPILVDSHDPQVVIETVAAIAPTFGAIQLEASAPRNASSSKRSFRGGCPSPSCTTISTARPSWYWRL